MCWQNVLLFHLLFNFSLIFFIIALEIQVVMTAILCSITHPNFPSGEMNITGRRIFCFVPLQYCQVTTFIRKSKSFRFKH